MDRAIVNLQEQLRKLTKDIKQVRDLHNETLIVEALMSVPLTSHTLPLVKTLIMRKEELEEEGI